MPALRPLPSVLPGRFVQLEPLTAGLLPDLHRAIALPEVFAGGYGGGPAGLRTDPEEFTEWARTYYRWGELPFAVRLLAGGSPGTVVGTTSLADLDLPHESAQLGWTAYHPSVWGTAVNAEAKLLLLGLAFDAGFGRVSIQADARNERSRAAIAGIGATFEGIRRREKRRADGSWRDTAVYSILAGEWPASAPDSPSGETGLQRVGRMSRRGRGSIRGKPKYSTRQYDSGNPAQRPEGKRRSPYEQ